MIEWIKINDFEIEIMKSKSNLLNFDKYEKLSSQKGLKFDKVLFVFGG
jgi:hypothetical protein